MTDEWRVDWFSRGTNRIASSHWYDTEHDALEAAARRREHDPSIGRARISREGPLATHAERVGTVHARRIRRYAKKPRVSAPLLLAGAAAAVALFFTVKALTAPASPPALTA